MLKEVDLARVQLIYTKDQSKLSKNEIDFRDKVVLELARYLPTAIGIPEYIRSNSAGNIYKEYVWNKQR